MFEKLRRAFSEALDNFNSELNRDAIPENVDQLLVGMRQELVGANAHIRKLTEDLGTATSAFERETKDVETCLRREHMANEIGDSETAQVARQYAEKHERLRIVLEQKVAALTGELAVAKSEYESMTAQYKSAESSRATLTAQAGRSQARDSLNEADDLFAQLDRMEEKIEDEDTQAKAARDLHEEFEPGGTYPDTSPIPPARDLDDRLEDLKRRMGQDD